MIRVNPAPEPVAGPPHFFDFDARVRRKGLAWLKQYAKGKPYPYWTACRPSLYDAYGGYCCYTTFRISPRDSAVVEHFLPKSANREEVYEWRNYRLASFHVNSVKGSKANVIDPMDLPEDAFTLTADMSLKVNPEAAWQSDRQRTLAAETVKSLQLDSLELKSDRRAWMAALLGMLKTNPGSVAELAVLFRQRSAFLYREAERRGYFS